MAEEAEVADIELLNSQWLIKMLSRSSPTPEGRILALFDILDYWSNAPNFNAEISHDPFSNFRLIKFLEEQAKAYGSEDPKIFADQIVYIVWSSMQGTIGSPDRPHLSYGKEAVKALLLAHKSNKLKSWMDSQKTSIYSTAACLLLVFGLTISNSSIISQETLDKHINTHTFNSNGMSLLTAKHSYTSVLTPYESAAYYQKYDEIRGGICEYQEVLSLPAEHRTIYLENVVKGKLPSTSEELAITNYYMNDLNCYFSPFLGEEFRT